MELVLVRHGQPEWSVDGASVSDPRLTDLGRAQAQLVAEHLGGEHFDHVLVSPLRRARETAEPIVDALDTAPQVLDWMAEITNPAWDDEPVEVVERIFAETRARTVDELWEGLDGGESFHDFHDRVSTGLTGHLAALGARLGHDHPRLWEIDDPNRRMLYVAHGGTDAVMIGLLLGIPPVPWEWERFVSYHASVTMVESVELAGAHAFTLRRLSDLSHLPPELHTV